MQRVLRQQAGDRPDPGAIIGEACRLCQQLRERLAGLIGRRGVEVLLSRALKLATAQFPCLKEVQTDEDRGLSGVDGSLADLSVGEVTAALAAVIAWFLDLLAAFVGSDLASHVVGEVLPEPPPMADPGQEDS